MLHDRHRDPERRLAELLLARRVLLETIIAPDAIERAGLEVPQFMAAEDLISERLTKQISFAQCDIERQRRQRARRAKL